jgi:WW domain-containing oxidoreductase
VRANAVHPGAIKTNLQNNNATAKLIVSIASSLGFFKSIPEGAATSVYVASSPEVRHSIPFIFVVMYNNTTFLL